QERRFSMIVHVLKARSVHLSVGLLITLVVNLPAQTADVERQGSALTQTVVCPGFWTQVSSSGPAPRGGHDLAWVPRSEAHPELKSAVPHTRAAEGKVVLFGGSGTNSSRL